LLELIIFILTISQLCTNCDRAFEPKTNSHRRLTNTLWATTTVWHFKLLARSTWVQFADSPSISHRPPGSCHPTTTRTTTTCWAPPSSAELIGLSPAYSAAH